MRQFEKGEKVNTEQISDLRRESRMTCEDRDVAAFVISYSDASHVVYFVSLYERFVISRIKYTERRPAMYRAMLHMLDEYDEMMDAASALRQTLRHPLLQPVAA